MIRPLRGKLLVEIIEGPIKMTPGGILIPEKSQPLGQKALVRATGQSAGIKKGKNLPHEVEVGDVVLVPHYSGTLVHTDGQDLLLIKESEVLAKTT